MGQDNSLSCVGDTDESLAKVGSMVRICVKLFQGYNPVSVSVLMCLIQCDELVFSCRPFSYYDLELQNKSISYYICDRVSSLTITRIAARAGSGNMAPAKLRGNFLATPLVDW